MIVKSRESRADKMSTFAVRDVDIACRWIWMRRTGEGALQSSPPPLLVTAAEARIVADTDPGALRALLLPDYDGVANSFTKLLLRVIRRCKWDGQIEGRVLHACEALGVREGRPVPVGALAKRLQRFGLAWHSFTIEECQAFVGQELDTDQDGTVGVPDIFAFLSALQPPHQAQRPYPTIATRSSRPRTAPRSEIRLGVRRPHETRRKAAAAAGLLFVTRKIPRGLQQKLLTAAGQARSRGVNVLETLLKSVHRSSSSPSASRSLLGAEATCFFFQNIGVDFEDFGERSSSSSSVVLKTSPGRVADRARSNSPEGALYRRIGRSERKVEARRKQSPPEESRFQGSVAEFFSPGDTRVEPWSASRDQGQVRGNAGNKEWRSRAEWNASARPAWRYPPDPTSTTWEHGTHAPGFQRPQDSFPDHRAEKEATFIGGAMGGGKAGDGGPLKEDGTYVSQRLRRAARDLKRMQAEYVRLEQQVRGGETEAGSIQRSRPLPAQTPPPASAQASNDSAADNANIAATTANDKEATPRPYNQNTRSSFCHGHSNPRNGGTHHLYFRSRHGENQLPCASPGSRETFTGPRGTEERTANEEQDGNEHRCDGEGHSGDDDCGRTRKCFSSWLRPSSSSRSAAPSEGTKPAPVRNATATASSPSIPFERDETAQFRYRPPWFAGWPQHDPDTRRCRALLLMAAQGKTSQEEVFDPANARNGFSRIQKHQAFGFGEAKEGRSSKPGRPGHDPVSARNLHRGRTDKGERGRSCRRGCITPAMTSSVHSFLRSPKTERRGDAYCMVSEKGTAKDWRDRTPERRPARPPAIKSPMYARCRSEERNVWDNMSGRWKRSRPKQDLCRARGHSVDSSTRTRGPRSATPAWRSVSRY